MNSENNKDVYYLIQKRVMISGEELIDANPGFDQDGNPAVMFALSTLGGKNLEGLLVKILESHLQLF